MRCVQWRISLFVIFFNIQKIIILFFFLESLSGKREHETGLFNIFVSFSMLEREQLILLPNFFYPAQISISQRTHSLTPEKDPRFDTSLSDLIHAEALISGLFGLLSCTKWLSPSKENYLRKKQNKSKSTSCIFHEKSFTSRILLFLMKFI